MQFKFLLVPCLGAVYIFWSGHHFKGTDGISCFQFSQGGLYYLFISCKFQVYYKKLPPFPYCSCISLIRRWLSRDAVGTWALFWAIPLLSQQPRFAAALEELHYKVITIWEQQHKTTGVSSICECNKAPEPAMRVI